MTDEAWTAELALCSLDVLPGHSSIEVAAQGDDGRITHVRFRATRGSPPETSDWTDWTEWHGEPIQLRWAALWRDD